MDATAATAEGAPGAGAGATGRGRSTDDADVIEGVGVALCGALEGHALEESSGRGRP